MLTYAALLLYSAEALAFSAIINATTNSLSSSSLFSLGPLSSSSSSSARLPRIHLRKHSRVRGAPHLSKYSRVSDSSEEVQQRGAPHLSKYSRGRGPQERIRGSTAEAEVHLI
jgi:hypothetical protein